MAADASLAGFVTTTLLEVLQAEREAGARSMLRIRDVSVFLVYGTEDAASATQDQVAFDSIAKAEAWLAERDRPILASRDRLQVLPVDRLGRLTLHLKLSPGTTAESQIG